MGGGGCARSSAMRAADSTERTGRVPWATKWIREFRSAASTRKTSSSESNTAQPGSYLCVGSIGDTIVRFAMRHALSRLALLITVAAFAPPDAAASPQIDSAYGPLPVFELHSGFWMNLHHTLYQQARQQREKQSGRPNATPSSRLSDAEQREWDAAVAYYAANFANKDLLFSTELILLKNQLGDFEDCVELSGAKKKTCDAGLPAKITQVLDSAAPAYRDRWSGAPGAVEGIGTRRAVGGDLSNEMAGRKNSRGRLLVRELGRRLHNAGPAAPHHFKHRSSQPGKRRPGSPLSRSLARNRRARAGGHCTPLPSPR